MAWSVRVSKRVVKQINTLPERIRTLLQALVKDIQISGPVRGNWPNYSALEKNRHHCHLKKGRPCYVAIWEVTDKDIRLVEVKYVGTHEKAPY